MAKRLRESQPARRREAENLPGLTHVPHLKCQSMTRLVTLRWCRDPNSTLLKHPLWVQGPKEKDGGQRNDDESWCCPTSDPELRMRILQDNTLMIKKWDAIVKTSRVGAQFGGSAMNRQRTCVSTRMTNPHSEPNAQPR